jgi:hypothetical protein
MVRGETPGPKLVGQIGGATYAVAVRELYAYIGVGPRLVVLNMSSTSNSRDGSFVSYNQTQGRMYGCQIYVEYPAIPNSLIIVTPLLLVMMADRKIVCNIE